MKGARMQLMQADVALLLGVQTYGRRIKLAYLTLIADRIFGFGQGLTRAKKLKGAGYFTVVKGLWILADCQLTPAIVGYFRGQEPLSVPSVREYKTLALWEATGLQSPTKSHFLNPPLGGKQIVEADCGGDDPLRVIAALVRTSDAAKGRILTPFEYANMVRRFFFEEDTANFALKPDSGFGQRVLALRQELAAEGSCLVDMQEGLTVTVWGRASGDFSEENHSEVPDIEDAIEVAVPDDQECRDFPEDDDSDSSDEVEVAPVGATRASPTVASVTEVSVPVVVEVPVLEGDPTNVGVGVDAPVDPPVPEPAPVPSEVTEVVVDNHQEGGVSNPAPDTFVDPPPEVVTVVEDVADEAVGVDAPVDPPAPKPKTPMVFSVPGQSNPDTFGATHRHLEIRFDGAIPSAVSGALCREFWGGRNPFVCRNNLWGGSGMQSRHRHGEKGNDWFTTERGQRVITECELVSCLTDEQADEFIRKHKYVPGHEVDGMHDRLVVIGARLEVIDATLVPPVNFQDPVQDKLWDEGVDLRGERERLYSMIAGRKRTSCAP